jgi:hypothetical protein
MIEFLVVINKLFPNDKKELKDNELKKRTLKHAEYDLLYWDE